MNDDDDNRGPLGIAVLALVLITIWCVVEWGSALDREQVRCSWWRCIAWNNGTGNLTVDGELVYSDKSSVKNLTLVTDVEKTPKK